MIRPINVDPDLYGKEVTYWGTVYGHENSVIWDGPVDGILTEGNHFNIRTPSQELHKILVTQQMQYMEIEPSWQIVTKEEPILPALSPSEKIVKSE